ncbi:MAG: hypothetical protein D6741_20265, partial [Planctomycetota bacterium]
MPPFDTLVFIRPNDPLVFWFLRKEQGADVPSDRQPVGGASSMRSRRATALNPTPATAWLCAGRSKKASALYLILLVIGQLVGIGGTRPLRSETAPEVVTDPGDAVDELLEERQRRREALRQEELPDYELGKVRVFPDREGGELPVLRCAHIQRLYLPAQANKQDIQGTLRVEFRAPKSKRPILLWGGDRVVVERPVRLAKGQIKELASDVLTPSESGPVVVHSELRDRRGRVVAVSDTDVFLDSRLEADVIVLCRTPEQYGFLERLPVFAAPWDIATAPGGLRVCRYAGNRKVPLPDNLSAWAGIAYVVWDQADPNVLDKKQQATLLTWLHFGGQLLVSGPDSMESLRGSFLEPYLPCRPPDDDWTTSFAPERFPALVEPLIDNPKPPTPLETLRSVYGIKLEPQASGREVPETGGLFYECRIGRGRIIVSAFPLSHPALVEWPLYDLVWRGWLLRTPPRFWQFGEMVISYRYTSREACKQVGTCWWVGRDDRGRFSGVQARGRDRDVNAEYREFACDPQLCNDDALTQTIVPKLREECRIRVPPKRFVVAMLIGYVGLTIPCVWIVFRLAGKPEWSWAVISAAAVVWTIIVVRQSQMNIGFVRAETGIDIVEIEPNCSTARLAGWTGIYSSLATTFDLSVADAGGIVLPVSATSQNEPYALFEVQPSRQLVLHRDGGTTLEDFRQA